MTLATIWDKLKEIVQKMVKPKTVEQILHFTPSVSTKMVEAIELWSDMYEDKSPWLREPDLGNPTSIKSLGLPSFIASEKARMAVLEMKSQITPPMDTSEFGKSKDTKVKTEYDAITNPTIKIKETPINNTERADFLNAQYKKLLSKIRTQLEYGIAKGGLVIKPYVVVCDALDENGNEVNKVASIEFDYIQADSFFPLAFNGGGEMVECAFIQRKIDKQNIYTRLEHHRLENNVITVTNRAFVTTNKTDNYAITEEELGREIKLTDVFEWSNLKPEQKIKNVDRLLLGYFKVPEANTVDPHSPLGVSGFSRAVRLIEQADLQYSRMLWEFEGGELAIDIDRDALVDVKDTKGNSHYVNPKLQQRLFRPVDLGESNTYNVFNPALRDESLLNGLNALLMRIEDVCALSRGTLSNAMVEAKTATELKILKQRSYSANAEIQKALEHTLRDVIYVMDVYATLYNITPKGDYEVSFEWDDSIISDVETELGKRITLYQNNIASRVELRMWYFGETERQAMEALEKIDEETRKKMEATIVQGTDEQTVNNNIEKTGKSGKDEIDKDNNGASITTDKIKLGNPNSKKGEWNKEHPERNRKKETE